MTDRTMERLTYSTREFAELNGVSERTVQRWIRDRVVKSVKIAGTRRIPADAFRRKLGEVSHTPPHTRAVV
jgi:excisionase family DNA binding protein